MWEILNMWTIVLSLLLVAPTIAWLAYQIKSGYQTQQEVYTPQYPDLPLRDVYSRHITPQDYFPRVLQYWSYYAAGPGVAVQGWPSHGGIYTLEVSSRVEIDFLELDPFNKTPRPTKSDPEWRQKEDKHCDLSE
jgi:hypothetical protein